VLVITASDLDEYVLGGIRRGAGGLLLKDQGADGPAEAVRIVASGEATIPPATVKSHVSSILENLRLTGRLQIAVWAHDHNTPRS
jgi:DNA-binding NarL/FixJ family response regulator